MEIKEPDITYEDILIPKDGDFRPDHVCIVSGSGTGIGRATAVAAAANKLTVVGLDVNEEEGKKTQDIAREMGGQMIFIKTDLTKDEEITGAVGEAAKLGTIKYLANIAGIQHVLHGQGLLASPRCLDPSETLSPGQADEIRRVRRDYPHLIDDDFVAEHLAEWMS